MNLSDLLLDAKGKGASDLHLNPGHPPAQRIHGKLHLLGVPPLTGDDIHRLVLHLLSDDQKKRLAHEFVLRLSCEVGDVRVRADVFRMRGGDAVSFRLLPSIVPSLENLKMPPILYDFCRLRTGLVLIGGESGSGRSTTVAAMINQINSTESRHIVTIEDAIEFAHEPKKSIVSQREIGQHTHSFAQAACSAMQEDADVIVADEIRDSEVLAFALRAVESGRLVFATVHTSSARSTVEWLVNLNAPDQQQHLRQRLGASLRAIVCQALVERRGKDGRVCALEILTGTPGVRSLIIDAKFHQLSAIMQVSEKQGMRSMDQHLKELVYEGAIDKQTALELTEDKKLFQLRADPGGTSQPTVTEIPTT